MHCWSRARARRWLGPYEGPAEIRIATQYAAIARFFHQPFQQVLDLTAEQTQAYHGQIDPLRAAELLDLFYVIRCAMNGDKSEAEAFIRKLEARARGKEERVILLAGDEALQRWANGR